MNSDDHRIPLNELASRLITKPEREVPVPLRGGPSSFPLSEIALLSLIPWFCDPGIHWAIRLRSSNTETIRHALNDTNDLTITDSERGLTIVVPGDGITFPLWVLQPIGAALVDNLRSGDLVELITANIGVLARDEWTAVDVALTAGDQDFSGVVENDRTCRLTLAAPEISVEQFMEAINIARMIMNRSGPWIMRDAEEAKSVVRGLIGSVISNTSDVFIRRRYRIRGSEIHLLTPLKENDFTRLPGLALQVFRLRFPSGPWDTRSAAQLDFNPLYAAARDFQKFADAIMNEVVES